MNTRPIIVTCIFISFAGLLFLSEVRARLNGAHEQEKVARFWKDRVGQEQLKKLVIMGRFADFKQEVATLIPGAFPNLKSKTEKARLRDLASVIPHETQYSVSLGYSADAMLVSGKEMVKKRKYKDGVRMLQQLIDQFPDSYHVVEAHYLITEAFSQLDNNDKVVEWVEKMVELFPESPLTGYAMLKVGDIYEIESRHEDAIQVYKTIIAVYKDELLLKQAQTSLKELEL